MKTSAIITLTRSAKPEQPGCHASPNTHYTTFQSVKVTIDGSKDMAKDMLNDHLSWIKQCIFDYIDNIQIDMKRVSCDGKGFTDADVEIK